jgi:hypothetical protein
MCCTFTTFAAEPDSVAHVKDFTAPIGALCGVLIAGLVSWFNARKTPPDRRQTLIALYRDCPIFWPERSVSRSLSDTK